MSNVKYPEITVKLLGKDSNAFAIMGAVKTALRRNKVPKEEIDLYLEQSMSGTYDNLLQTAFEWVDIK
jgi:hypothetical protein